MNLTNYIHQRQAARCLMRTACFCLLTTLALPSLAEQHALLIGVSDYKDKRIPDLEGPVNDVQSLAAVLLAQWNFKPHNIRTLLDSQATETGILQALDQLEQTTRPGDDILVYFSGHGTSARDPQLGARLNLPDGSGAIVTADFNPEMAARNNGTESANDGMLVGRHELRPRFEQLDQQRNVLIVFDTCFSGNTARTRFSPRAPHKVRNLSLVNFRNRSMLGAMSDKAIQNATQTATQTATQGTPLVTRGCSNCVENLSQQFSYRNLVYFGAAAEDQLAVDFSQAEIDAGLVTTIDGKPHGGFTDSLLRVLSTQQADQAPMSYGRLFNLLLNQFNKHCAHCGHNPVSLPIINDDALALLQRPFLSATVLPADSSAEQNQSPVATSTPSTDSGLDIVLRGKIADTAETPDALRNAVQLYNTTTQTPDISFSLQQQTLVAHSADGQMIREFERNVSTNELSQWLEARQWLKQRRQADSQFDSGQLSVEFRHPLLGNQVNAGDHVFFNLHSARDASMLILVMNSAGKLSVIYPSTLAEAEKVLHAGTRIRLPAKDEAAIEVTPPWGIDMVLFYALPPGHTELLKLHELSGKFSGKDAIDPSNPGFAAFESGLNSGNIAYSSSAIRIVSGDSP